MLSALVDYNDTSSALKYWSKNTGVQIGSRLDQKIVGFLDRKNMGLVKWYTWPLKFLLRTGRYATAKSNGERGRISSSLLFIPMLPPWPFSRHAGRSCKIREFSFIIPLTLDTRTHTNMDHFNPFLHTEVDQFNPLALTNLYYLQSVTIWYSYNYFFNHCLVILKCGDFECMYDFIEITFIVLTGHSL